MLPTPVELREHARRYLDAARKAVNSETRRRLASYAAALAQVAEAIERHVSFAGVVGGEKIEDYKRMIARALDPDAQQLAETLLLEQDVHSMQRKRIRLWRMRAEELRVTAETFVIPSAQETLRRAAANYDMLADNAEALLSGRRSTPSDDTGSS